MTNFFPFCSRAFFFLQVQFVGDISHSEKKNDGGHNEVLMSSQDLLIFMTSSRIHLCCFWVQCLMLDTPISLLNNEREKKE